jgi:hypothetical protein
MGSFQVQLKKSDEISIGSSQRPYRYGSHLRIIIRDKRPEELKIQPFPGTGKKRLHYAWNYGKILSRAIHNH